ncbi:TetR/AcrR family transcriptional regulator [Kytococcus sedentarius]|uniref:TetR/AcrR family transcriptional regulator n=1 Tax=Kytococcus sedentarius TaxID=1276 RepID=UPI0035BB9E50
MASEAILQAATEAFAEVGFSGTSTRDIATRAGMSPAALYAHFRSKEEVLHQISALGTRRVLDGVLAASAARVTAPERLGAVAHELTLWHATSCVRARVVNYELAHLTPEHLAEVRALRRQIHEVVRSIVEAGTRTGELQTQDASLTATAVVSMCVDVARWFRPDGAWSAEQVAEHHQEMALRMAGAQPGD